MTVCLSQMFINVENAVLNQLISTFLLGYSYSYCLIAEKLEDIKIGSFSI